MSKAPTAALDDASGTGLPPGSHGFFYALARSPRLEWLVVRGVTVWFLLLAFNMANGLVLRWRQIGGLPDAQAAADLLARVCMLVFFCLAAWFTLVRSRPLAKAPGIAPRFAALLGVTLLFGLSLCPRLDHPPAWLLFLSAGLMALGNALAMVVLNHLGHSFSVMAEARRLVTDGPYRIIRHPLYVSEGIAIIGAFLPYWSLPALALFLLLVAAQGTRMYFEEGVLRETFPDYADYARRTARLIPGVW